MLPSGVLAKHGYTTKWGFFSGVCSGSGRLPFEKSTDAIADAVVAVKADISSTDREIASIEDLTSPINDGTSVWVNRYIEDDYEYRWVNAKLHDFSTDSTSYSYPISRCSYTTINALYSRRANLTAPITESINAYTDAWKMHTVQEWARYLNRKFAHTLASENTSRKNWIVWQKDRIAKWAPAPLTPR
jgi:hypothetical protein